MTAPVAMLLDSSCDLDLLQADEFGIDLLIQPVHFAGEVLLDMTDIDPATFFAMLDAGTPAPEMAPFTVEAYARMLERVLMRASQVFAIHPSYYSRDQLEVAYQAAARFPGRVTVFETRAMSSPMALVAQDAKHLLGKGLSAEEVTRQLREWQAHTRTTIYLNDAGYMRRSGHLAPLLAGVPEGSRPLLGFMGQELHYLGAGATPSTGYRMLSERFRRDLARSGAGSRAVIMYSPGAEDYAQELEKEAHRSGAAQVTVTPVGLVIAGVLGPGSLGYAVAPAWPSES